jgi:hypothetical protein
VPKHVRRIHAANGKVQAVRGCGRFTEHPGKVIVGGFDERELVRKFVHTMMFVR